jgi:hypothetical protein
LTRSVSMPSWITVSRFRQHAGTVERCHSVGVTHQSAASRLSSPLAFFMRSRQRAAMSSSANLGSKPKSAPSSR